MNTYELCASCNQTVDTELSDDWRRCIECRGLLCKNCKDSACPECQTQYKETVSNIKSLTTLNLEKSDENK